MSRQPQLLWEVPAFLDYVQPALTPDAVRTAEQQLRVRLPRAYLAMLEVQNGGHLRATWPDLPHQRLDGIGPQFPSITRDEAWWRAPDAEDDIWVPDEPELLIAFDGGGHWNLCFDYRGGGPHAEPAVTYIDIDSEDDEPVAVSVDAFLDGLVDELEHTAIRISADLTLDAFAAAFTEATGREVVDQGNSHQGYRQLRVGLTNGTWMWIGPNRVPAGFRREGDMVVVTMQTALRLPQHPACQLIVTCTPDAVAETRAALEATGLRPEPAAPP